MTQTHYETLGVEPSANAQDIQAKYRELIKENHPDIIEAGLGKRKPAEEFLKVVNAAYDVLKDPNDRAEYDRSIGLSTLSSGFSSDITGDAFEAYASIIEAQANMVQAGCEMWASYFDMWGDLMKPKHAAKEDQAMEHAL